MKTELVVAWYKEKLTWIDEIKSPLIIYHKAIDRRFKIPNPRNLPNVGREAHTYLHHIVTEWDRLADWTVFTQADPAPHLSNGTIQQLLDAHESPTVVVPWLCRIKEWSDGGRLQWRGEWQARYRSEITPASLTMASWFRERLLMDLFARPHLCYHPGAIFGVPVARIKARPMAFYERLLDDVSHACHPEEAHYLERAWLYLWDIDSCGVVIPCK